MPFSAVLLLVFGTKRNVPYDILLYALTGMFACRLIVNLVGSPSGVVENLETIVESIPHAVALLSGS